MENKILSQLDVRSTALEIEKEIDLLHKQILLKKKRQNQLKKISEALQTGGKITDFHFDQVYPLSIRKLSGTHWTPVNTAIRAAELLFTDQSTHVLDVGAGCGKFCTIAALATLGKFTGVEQRSHLAEVALKTINQLKAERASFIHGNMMDLDWSEFNGFYLFNPFYENKVKSIRIDESIDHSQDNFFRYIKIVKDKLKTAKKGTKVVTYHGFGGEMPEGYKRVKRERLGSCYLELWIK